MHRLTSLSSNLDLPRLVIFKALALVERSVQRWVSDSVGGAFLWWRRIVDDERQRLASFATAQRMVGAALSRWLRGTILGRFRDWKDFTRRERLDEQRRGEMALLEDQASQQSRALAAQMAAASRAAAARLFKRALRRWVCASAGAAPTGAPSGIPVWRGGGFFGSGSPGAAMVGCHE